MLSIGVLLGPSLTMTPIAGDRLLPLILGDGDMHGVLPCALAATQGAEAKGRPLAYAGVSLRLTPTEVGVCVVTSARAVEEHACNTWKLCQCVKQTKGFLCCMRCHTGGPGPVRPPQLPRGAQGPLIPVHLELRRWLAFQLV